MKVSEILVEAATPPANPSFGEMQKHIYAFLLSKVKTDSGTKADIKTGFENDWFWTSHFDELHRVIGKYDPNHRSADFGYIYDNLALAIDDIVSKIDDKYNDPWNFEPGFKKPSITWPFEHGDISNKDMEALCKIIAPKAIFDFDVAKKEQQKLRNKQKAETRKSITQEHIDTAVELVKKYSKQGWEYMYKLMAREAKSKNAYWSWQDIIPTREAFANLSDAEALKKYCYEDMKAMKGMSREETILEMEYYNLDLILKAGDKKKNQEAMNVLKHAYGDKVIAKKIVAKL
jgi:hypothetical protein